MADTGLLAGLIALVISALVIVSEYFPQLKRFRPWRRPKPMLLSRPDQKVKTPVAVRRARAPQRKAARAHRQGMRMR